MPCSGHPRLRRSRQAGGRQVDDRGARQYRRDNGLEPGYQTANCDRAARAAAPRSRTARRGDGARAAELVGQPRRRLPPRIAQAYGICRRSTAPPCKILFDIYHQQISEGNLIPNIDRVVGRDRLLPVRRQPWPQRARHRRDQLPQRLRPHPLQGFKGIVGMEHGISGPGAEGEKALIRAYREADNF